MQKSQIAVASVAALAVVSAALFMRGTTSIDSYSVSPLTQPNGDPESGAEQGLAVVDLAAVTRQPAMPEAAKPAELVPDELSQEVETSYEADLPWEQVRVHVLAHGSFTRAEENLLRRRALEWKVGSRVQEEFPLSSFLPKGVHLTEFDRVDLDQLIAHHQTGLGDMADATIEIAKEAYLDYFGNEKFSRAVSGTGEFDKVPTDGSRFWLDAEMDIFGWSIQFAFRSKDYPVLEDQFMYTRQLKEIRKREIVAFFEKLSRGD